MFSSVVGMAVAMETEAGLGVGGEVGRDWQEMLSQEFIWNLGCPQNEVSMGTWQVLTQHLAPLVVALRAANGRRHSELVVKVVTWPERPLISSCRFHLVSGNPVGRVPLPEFDLGCSDRICAPS